MDESEIFKNLKQSLLPVFHSIATCVEFQRNLNFKGNCSARMNQALYRDKLQFTPVIVYFTLKYFFRC